MAVPAKLEPNESFPAESNVPEKDRAACLHAAKLYGLGYDRKKISQVLAEVMYGEREWHREDKLKAARQRLRTWESKQWFRDLVWDAAVVELDMAGPQILRGITKKAKRGRVDAAKLALSITGRHNEKEQAVPAAVTINIANIPRPAHQTTELSEEVAVESVTEDVD